MKGRSRIRTRGRIGSISLLAQATSSLGVAPVHYWSFTTNRALFNSVDVGAVTSTPGWSFTRADAQSAYAQDLAGNLIPFATGVLRRTDRGVLIEGSRTNLFLNSATGGTQSVTVTAAAHTLSFYGTGTITLSGVSVAGPLVGTGASNRVTLTFTPTAGSLTLTVTGSCTNVNLELGAFASSWIPTVGASATRAADVLTVSSPGVTYPLSLFAEFERVVDTGATEVFFQIDDGDATDLARLNISTADFPAGVTVAASATQASLTVGSALALATPVKTAMRVTTNDIQMARGGVLGTQDTVATNPATPNTIRFGTNTTGNDSFGYLRKAAIFNSALNDAALQRAST